MMQEIRLNQHKWTINTDIPIGAPGGFGAVFEGSGGDSVVAIKRLNLQASKAAHRELSICEELSSRQLQHIVPILDWGQDAESDRYYIVMPKCEKNLQEYINETDSGLPVTEAIKILLDILVGLQEVKDITHRDLKPANILLHEGKWKIADFGIAKFVEDSTSLESLRSCLTPSYAAPEQWKNERPASATDIYAVGCIAHTLITGTPPFFGDCDDLREKHLNSAPEMIPDFPSSPLVQFMLRKLPEARPSLKRCIEVFQKSVDSKQSGSKRHIAVLANAVGIVAQEESEKELRHQEFERVRSLRTQLYSSAVDTLKEIHHNFIASLKEAAHEVIAVKGSENEYIDFGRAVFNFNVSHRTVKPCDDSSGIPNRWGMHEKCSSWDFIAMTEIRLKMKSTNGDMPKFTRSANLIYGRPNNDSDYRWYEMSFFSCLGKSRQKDKPYAIKYIWEIDKALSNTMYTDELAHEVVSIDGEDEEAFIDYWIEQMAKASVGNMEQPRYLPFERRINKMVLA